MNKVLNTIIKILVISISLSLLLTPILDINLNSRQIVIKTRKIKKGEPSAVEIDNKKYSDLIYVAGPGDLLQIKKGKIFVNNKPFVSKHFRNLYIVLPKTQVSIEQPIEALNLSSKQANLLKNKIIINEVVDSPFMFDHNIYPYNSLLSWNKDNLGPMVIPHKNMVVKLNKYSYIIYKPLIEKWEKDTITYTKKGFFNSYNKKISYYKFKNDYYFLINKYTAYPIDCRTWGPLPKENIIGKVYSLSKKDSSM